MRRDSAALAVLGMLLPVGACTSSEPSAFHPVLRWGPCPADIDATFLTRHQCGTLTVLENRADPNGPTVTLRVAKAWPVGESALPGIGNGLPEDFGDPTALGGDMATGSTRMRVVAVGMEYRGQGPHAHPSLQCPETAPLGVEAAGLPDRDPGIRRKFVSAVAACSRRLRSDGVEPAEFGPVQQAADLEDLRRALGIQQWRHMGSYGTESLTLLQYLHDYPGRVGAVYLDSPWFPEENPITQASAGLRSALTALFKACAQQGSCRAAYPDLPALWQRALRRTAHRPLHGHAAVGGSPVSVLVDQLKLIRFTRFILGGDGPANLTWLPRIIADAAAARLNPHLATLVANDPIYCAGYRPLCTHQDDFALGVFLTQLCGHRYATPPGTSTAGPYQSVFDESPYLAACKAWNVPRDNTLRRTPPWHVPALLLAGKFDSWSRPSWSARHAAIGGPDVWAVPIPATTHNALGFSECAVTLRNDWTFDPTSPPPHLCGSQQLHFH